MQVEDITRIRFTARRAADNQRDITISLGVFCQVIVDNQRVFTCLHELLAHSTTGIRGQVFQWGGFRSSCHHEHGMLHCPMLIEDLNSTRNRRVLLADGDVDTDKVFAFLVDDRINSNGSLTRLAVADDQFALTTTDGDHTVDSLNTRLHRSIHRLAGNHAWSNTLDTTCLSRINRSFVVDWLTQWIDHTVNHRVTDRNRDNSSRGAHL